MNLTSASKVVSIDTQFAISKEQLCSSRQLLRLTCEQLEERHMRNTWGLLFVHCRADTEHLRVSHNVDFEEADIFWRLKVAVATSTMLLFVCKDVGVTHITLDIQPHTSTIEVTEAAIFECGRIVDNQRATLDEVVIDCFASADFVLQDDVAEGGMRSYDHCYTSESSLTVAGTGGGVGLGGGGGVNIID